MYVGMSMAFQNLGNELSDGAVYENELRLAGLAEPLGFDGIWATEHHFTDYSLCPDPIQFLTYMAGRTKHVELGTMVVILPWHDPVRVAESVSMLDNLSGGRLVLGIGRGLGRIEFEGFGMDMTESRGRFVEAAELVLRGLEDGYLEYEGEFYKQARRDIRPAPRGSFVGRTFAAAVSPESMEIMASLGVGILIVPQKPWHVVESDLETYREIFRRVRGAEPPQTTVASWVFCDPSEERAREMAKTYIGRYYESVMSHYELGGRNFDNTRGYEYYAKMSQRIASVGEQEAVDFFIDLHVYGTPEQCYERIVETQRRVDADKFLGVFSYAGMPQDEVDRNVRLFAREVMPELKKLDVARAVV